MRYRVFMHNKLTGEQVNFVVRDSDIAGVILHNLHCMYAEASRRDYSGPEKNRPEDFAITVILLGEE